MAGDGLTWLMLEPPLISSKIDHVPSFWTPQQVFFIDQNLIKNLWLEIKKKLPLKVSHAENFEWNFESMKWWKWGVFDWRHLITSICLILIEWSLVFERMHSRHGVYMCAVIRTDEFFDDWLKEDSIWIVAKRMVTLLRNSSVCCIISAPFCLSLWRMQHTAIWEWCFKLLED